MAHPLLLLDGKALMQVLANGTFKVQSITFEEARAIIDMHMGRDDIISCYDNLSLDKVVHEYVGVPKRDFPYRAATGMEEGQDAIVFRQHITESVTRPIVKTSYGNEAKKIQNVYIYCELVSRLA